MQAASAGSGAGFVTGQPRLFLDESNPPDPFGVGLPTFAVSSAARFLFVASESNGTRPAFHVVLNWFRDLEAHTLVAGEGR